MRTQRMISLKSLNVLQLQNEKRWEGDRPGPNGDNGEKLPKKGGKCGRGYPQRT